MLVEQQVRANAKRSIAYPLTLPTVVRWPNGKREDIGTKADHTFFLVDGRGEADRRALLFLEYENTKKDFAKILMKYLKYADAHRRKLHTERFGSKNFRVLFVLNEGPDYLALFQSVYQQNVARIMKPGAFLHTTLAEYERAGPLGDIWVDGAGRTKNLLKGE